MVNCFNILCPHYRDQLDCHDTCPMFLRATREEAAPKKPSDFLIFNRPYGVPPNTLLLFHSLQDRPKMIPKEGVDFRTIYQLNADYPGIVKEPAFQRLVTTTQFILHEGGLYIPADLHKHMTCPVFLRLLWHKEGDLTAADLVLKMLVKGLYENGNCADCERIPLDPSLLQKSLEEMLVHLLKQDEKLKKVDIERPPLMDTTDMQRTSFSVVQGGRTAAQVGLPLYQYEQMLSITRVQWPASFPPLPSELNEKLKIGTLTVDDILPYLPIPVARQDIRIINGVIQVALYSTNGGYKQLWCWGNLEEVLERERKERERKKREADDIDE